MAKKIVFRGSDGIITKEQYTRKRTPNEERIINSACAVRKIKRKQAIKLTNKNLSRPSDFNEYLKKLTPDEYFERLNKSIENQNKKVYRFKNLFNELDWSAYPYKYFITLTSPPERPIRMGVDNKAFTRFIKKLSDDPFDSLAGVGKYEIHNGGFDNHGNLHIHFILASTYSLGDKFYGKKDNSKSDFRLINSENELTKKLSNYWFNYLYKTSNKNTDIKDKEPFIKEQLDIREIKFNTKGVFKYFVSYTTKSKREVEKLGFVHYDLNPITGNYEIIKKGFTYTWKEKFQGKHQFFRVNKPKKISPDIEKITDDEMKKINDEYIEYLDLKQKKGFNTGYSRYIKNSSNFKLSFHMLAKKYPEQHINHK